MEVAVGAIGTLLPKLDDLLSSEFTLEEHVRKGIKSLVTEVTMLRAFLHEVATIPPEQLNERVKIWARRVKELSYKIVDIVDAFMEHAEEDDDPANQKNRAKKLLKKTIKLLKKDKDLHWSALKEAVDQANELTGMLQRYDFEIWDTKFSAGIDPRIMALYTDVKELIGIEDSKDKLINMLTEGDDWSKQPLKTISIVGFGGLGKTALAKAVYDKIKWQFDCGAFVLVSQNPDSKKVFKDILYGLDKNKYADIHNKAWDEYKFINELIEYLNGKRYLIVTDDIWNGEVWQFIKLAFSGENNLGSRIITTTRIVSVSEECCPSANDSIYHMEPLSDDDSKKLLYLRIFGSATGCPHEFEQVSSDILKKCGGVPLAILAVSSVLASGLQVKSKDEWHVLLKSIGHAFIKDRNWIVKQRIVSFSYDDLPSYLKTALLYLSTFPGGHPIERDRLVKKWIMERIVTGPGLGLEEVASQYLSELVDRNIIHPLEWNNNSEVISYHIHHLMHDFLKTMAKEEKFAASLDDKDISSAHRMNFDHLSVDCPDMENLIGLSSMAFDCGVRSLTVFGHANRILLGHFEGIRHLDLEGCKGIERADLQYICSMVLLKWLCLAKTQITDLPPEIGNLQYLEGLDVGGTQITMLPPQIGNLKYLERLDVGGTQISQIPPQIVKLQRLKTLDARKSGVKDLPDEVVHLTRLVHLLIGDNESCEGVKLPDGFGKMTSMEQLGTIDLRKCSASSLEELAELPHLKEIAVVTSDDPEDTRIKNALFSFLNKSIRQRSLVVYSDFRLNTVQSSSPNKYLNYWKKHTVLRFLKVPIGLARQHLGMLDIRVCKLQEDDLKILGKLPRLHSLIVRLEVLPKKMIRISCAGFAKLESLYVDCRMPRVIFEERAMPKLEHLELKLYGGSGNEEHMSINHLLNLEKVTLRYSRWYATNKGVRETTEAVKTECKEHQNEITLCIAEEEKNGICNTKTAEVFQENKDARCTRMMTEIKQEDGHAGWTAIFDGDGTQEGCIHQSRSAIASSSRMTDHKQEAECKEHQNEITLCIAEENKDGTMKTEIFQENRVASCSRMTEIEEKEDTQEGGLHQSSHATASCSGTSEIEEVAE